jgi:hypothetical protein
VTNASDVETWPSSGTAFADWLQEMGPGERDIVVQVLELVGPTARSATGRRIAALMAEMGHTSTNGADPGLLARHLEELLRPDRDPDEVIGAEVLAQALEAARDVNQPPEPEGARS